MNETPNPRAGQAKPPLRVGMFGGAFDPPHWAHRALAETALGQLRLDHLHILPTGIFNVNVSIEQGLSLLGADQNISASYQDSQFTKAKAAVTSNQYFKLFDDFYLFSNQFYGQYPRDRLPGVEWLSVTDSRCDTTQNRAPSQGSLR